MTTADRALSVVVPTFREADNIGPLCERLDRAFHDAGIPYELVIVDDDSRDGVVEVVHRLADGYPVRIVVRHGPRDLSAAVLTGIADARHDVILVMDADLQHPPEQAPRVAQPVLDGQARICVGSRYVGSASRSSRWPARRRINSLVATALARPLTPVRDCMAGFFALHRDVVADWSRLRPMGYKILLEILARAPSAAVIEVPIDFATRAAGESKLTLYQQWRYLRHLGRLYRERYPVCVAAVVLIAAGGAVALVWWRLHR